MLKGVKMFRMKIMVELLLLAVVALVTICCTKGNPFNLEDDPKYWNHYVHDHTIWNFITNARVVDDQLFCTVQGGVLIFDDMKIMPAFNYNPLISSGLHYKPVLSDMFVASIIEFQAEKITFSKIRVHTENSSTGRNEINVTDFGEQFADHAFRVYKPLGVDFGIFEGNRFITIITTPKYQTMGGINSLVYAELDLDDRGIIRITNKHVWDIPTLAEARSTVDFIKVHRDKIYVAVYRNYFPDPGFYLVEIFENGLIKETFDPFEGQNIITFFEYQGYLCAYLNTRQVVCTTDGENWQYVATISPLMYWWYEIDDYLFVPLEDKIYLFTGDIFNLELYQLPTSNMKGMTISSVNKYKDDLVITTSNGIFYKSMKEISKDKKLIGPNNRGSINLQGE